MNIALRWSTSPKRRSSDGGGALLKETACQIRQARAIHDSFLSGLLKRGAATAKQVEN